MSYLSQSDLPQLAVLSYTEARSNFMLGPLSDVPGISLPPAVTNLYPFTSIKLSPQVLHSPEVCEPLWWV